MPLMVTDKVDVGEEKDNTSMGREEVEEEEEEEDVVSFSSCISGVLAETRLVQLFSDNPCLLQNAET